MGGVNTKKTPPNEKKVFFRIKKDRDYVKNVVMHDGLATTPAYRFTKIYGAYLTDVYFKEDPNVKHEVLVVGPVCGGERRVAVVSPSQLTNEELDYRVRLLLYVIREALIRCDKCGKAYINRRYLKVAYSNKAHLIHEVVCGDCDPTIATI